MKKVIKIGFPIVCIVLIGGTFILLNKFQSRVNDRAKINAEVSNSSKEIEKETGEENTVMENTSYTVSVEEQEKEKKTEDENEKEAIDIIKNKYTYIGTDDIYFTNEGKENGKYIVAVRQKSTTEASIYYIVDIEQKTYDMYK